jgi:hypothetical protein
VPRVAGEAGALARTRGNEPLLGDRAGDSQLHASRLNDDRGGYSRAALRPSADGAREEANRTQPNCVVTSCGR